MISISSPLGTCTIGVPSTNVEGSKSSLLESIGGNEGSISGRVYGSSFSYIYELTLGIPETSQLYSGAYLGMTGSVYNRPRSRPVIPLDLALASGLHGLKSAASNPAGKSTVIGFIAIIASSA
jgi:hypothetical protein